VLTAGVAGHMPFFCGWKGGGNPPHMHQTLNRSISLPIFSMESRTF